MRPLRRAAAASVAALLAALAAITASPPPYRPPFGEWSQGAPPEVLAKLGLSSA